VYDRCKSSVTEFRELSREVDNLQIILNEIKSYWEKHEKRRNSLAEEKTERLCHICGGCDEVLKDLSSLLDKHRQLGKTKSFVQRMRWAPRDIGPMRNRLVAQSTYLAAFNTTLTCVPMNMQQPS